MKNLKSLIAGLKLIKSVEGENTLFNAQNSILFIGDVSEYDDKQLDKLQKYYFYVNTEFDCFEYNLD